MDYIFNIMNVNFRRLKILFFSLLNVISFVSAGYFLGQVWTINCFLDSSSGPHSDRLYLCQRCEYTVLGSLFCLFLLGIPLLSFVFMFPQFCFFNSQRQKDWIFPPVPLLQCHHVVYSVPGEKPWGWELIGKAPCFLPSKRMCPSPPPSESVSFCSLSSSSRQWLFVLCLGFIVVFCKGVERSPGRVLKQKSIFFHC